MRAWRNWQTRTVQVRMGATPWRFKSSRPHHSKSKDPLRRVFFVYGDNCSALPFVPQTYLFRCETLCFILVDAALLSSGLSCLLL